jgi:hypothetical protein
VSYAKLALDVYDQLLEAGLIRRDTKFRETAAGGLRVTRVDVAKVAMDRQLSRWLARRAALEDMSFEIQPGLIGLLMQPLGRSSREYVVGNPRRRRVRRRV